MPQFIPPKAARQRRNCLRLGLCTTEHTHRARLLDHQSLGKQDNGVKKKNYSLCGKKERGELRSQGSGSRSQGSGVGLPRGWPVAVAEVILDLMREVTR